MPRDQRSKKVLGVGCFSFGQGIEKLGSNIIGLQEVMLSRIDDGKDDLYGWVRDSILYNSKVETPLLIRSSFLLTLERTRLALNSERYDVLPEIEKEEWHVNYIKALEEDKKKVPLSKRSGYLLDPLGRIEITEGNDPLLEFWLGPDLAQRYFSIHRESGMTQNHRPIRFSYSRSNEMNGQNFVMRQIHCGGKNVNWDISADYQYLANPCRVLTLASD